MQDASLYGHGLDPIELIFGLFAIPGRDQMLGFVQKHRAQSQSPKFFLIHITLDMLFQAGALVEHKDIADFLLFGVSIPLCNRFVEYTASFFGDFGFSIASRSRFRQKPDIAIAIAIASFSVSKVGQPIANGTRRWARIDLLLLVLVGFHQEIPLVSHLKGFISGLDEEPMNLRSKSHGGTVGGVLHLNDMRIYQMQN